MQTTPQPTAEPITFQQELARQYLRAKSLAGQDRAEAYRQQRRDGLSPAIVDTLFRDPSPTVRA